MENEKIISSTQKWIQDVVIGCNFCPFAAPVVKKNQVRYIVDDSEDIKVSLELLLHELIFLDENETVETTFIIYKTAYTDFLDYLDFVYTVDELVEQQDYEGIYQVASFHPDYTFADAPEEDPANFTNRSPFPMLHLLREESIEKALENYPNPDAIPERNMTFTRDKGYAYMKMMRDTCL